MTGVTWASIPDRIVQVQVPEGVTFTKLRAFDDRINVNFTGTTPPVADFASPAPQIDTVTLADGAEIRCSGLGPFFAVGDNAQFLIGDNAALLTGTHEVVDVTAAVTLSVFAQGSNSIVGATTIAGIVGSTLNLVAADSALFLLSKDQAGFLGTIAPSNATKVREYPTAILVGATLLSTTSQLVRVNPTAGAFTVTLPAAALHQGESIVFKNVTSSVNNVTIAAAGGDTVEGAATLVLSGDKFFTRITSDGVSAWWVTSA
jgi:hypothetical protein